MIAALGFHAGHLLAFVLLAATAYVAGRTACLRLALAGAAERWGVATALGLLLLAHLAFLLGLLGLLARGPLLAALAAVHLAGWRSWRELAAAGRRRWRQAPWRRVALGCGLALVALAPLFLLALYPPTGFDETLYHLPYARAFARSGGVPFLPALRFPVFPQLNELLFAGMLLLDDDVAAHLVQLLAVLATAAVLFAWGRSLRSPAAGWLAAALYLGGPIVVHLAGSAYVEPLLVLFVAAAFYAAERWRRPGSRGWLALAAAFAAGAAEVKYLGLFFVAALVVVVAAAAPRGRRLGDLLFAAATALMVLVPTYGRILYHTGNPLFPFLTRLFGASPWIFVDLPSPPFGERLAALAALPWNVVFGRTVLGRQPPYSPVVLMLLPLLAVAAARDGRVRRPALVAAAYTLLYLVVPGDSRYLLAALALLCAASGMALAGLLEGRVGPGPRRARLAAVLCAACFLPGWLYAGYRDVRQGPVPVTAAARDRYLAVRLPLYPALRFLNRTRGSGYTVYAVHAENMVYFADGTLLGDWNGPASYHHVLPAAGDPAALHRKLRELGVDFLLVVRDRDPEGLAARLATPEAQALFRRFYEDGAAEVFELRPVLGRGQP
jgi:dolichyl-phosphate-mannose-protein mannosyltransferase